MWCVYVLQAGAFYLGYLGEGNAYGYICDSVVLVPTEEYACYVGSLDPKGYVGSLDLIRYVGFPDPIRPVGSIDPERSGPHLIM